MSELYVVGGAVRDWLLNHKFNDRDIVVVGATVVACSVVAGTVVTGSVVGGST